MKLNLRSVDLNLLTVFDAIMRHGNLSKAAEKLAMTQSAASAALSRLRTTFDDELFVRSGHGMVPTPLALDIAQPIHEALTSIEGVIGSSKEFDPSTSKRVFKFVMGDLGEILLLPRLLQRLEVDGPSLSIQSLSSRDISNIELAKKSQVDFYFDYRLPDEGQLDFCKVTEEPLAVIARKNHPNINKRLTKKLFLQLKHLAYTHHHHHIAGLELMFGEQWGMSRDIFSEVQQLLAIPQLVLHTKGVATVPQSLARYFARLHPLEIYPFPFDVGALPGYLIWHRSLNRDKAHQWMKQLILDVVKKNRNSTS